MFPQFCGYVLSLACGIILSSDEVEVIATDEVAPSFLLPARSLVIWEMSSPSLVGKFY